ncbi:MAG: hypothetical protein GKR90_06780 [Pseudomonadales bacterium]|nr:hypothetical protein [Pseudomonadales bacterium]
MDIYIDFKSPAAYLAINPTIELAQLCNVSLNWLPLRTRQTQIPGVQENEDRGATHRRVRAIARQNTFLHYASVQDLEMRFRSDPGNTDLALAALATLVGDTTEFVRRAFNAYWTTNKALGDRDVVQALLDDADSDLDVSALDVSATIAASEELALAAGAIDAPAYIVANELFIGREHLPWIKELLSNG